METITIKKAKTAYQINDLIANRWSPRSFQEEPISEDHLMSLFEAARWAPSSMNEQPWRFVYTRRGEEAFDKIASTLMPGNKWAAKASVLLIALVKKTFDRNGSVNAAATHDLGLAIGNLGLQATEFGIGLHQMGGFDRHLLIEEFTISEEYLPITCIALGYFGDPDALDEPLKQRELAERKRRPLEELISHGKFNF